LPGRAHDGAQDVDLRSARLGMAKKEDGTVRCTWANYSPLEVAYHDKEWGRPSHDDTYLFEMINLEGAQAGLSWNTILRKRDGYRACFDGFDAKRIVKYDEKKIAALVQDERIVRHRQKIQAVVDNARAFLAVQRECGSFAAYVWGFVGGKPIVCGGKNVPIPESNALSKDLKKRGFRFVGPKATYAFMQAVGMVDDHSQACFRALKAAKPARAKP
jgi:DNA-3-methyladenine glycosylase I